MSELLRLRKPDVEVRAAESYRFAGVRSFGGGVFASATKLGAEFSYRQLTQVHADELVYPKLMAWEGAVGVVPRECDGLFVSPEFCVFEIDRERVLPRFIDLFFKAPSAMPMLAGMASGTNVRRRRIYPEQFVQCRLPLPPIEVQARIVRWLDELMQNISEVQRLRSEAAQDVLNLFDAEVSATFIRGFRAQTTQSARDLLLAQAARVGAVENAFNGAHPTQPVFRADGPHPVPRGWVWTDLGSVVTHLIDCINDTPDFSEEDTGYLGLKTSNVRPYVLDLAQRWFVTADDFRRWNRREAPRAGDIVLTREAPMGNACILPEQVTACLTQRLMLIRCEPEFVSAPYLLHFINSTGFKRQILDSCRGLTVPHIRVQDAPKLLVPLAPRPEQDAVVEHLDSLRNVLVQTHRIQTESEAELDALIPSTLDAAFRGQIVA